MMKNMQCKLSANIVYLSKDVFRYGTQGHLTQIFPTFPNTIVNLDFYMKTDSGLSWVSNDR